MFNRRILIVDHNKETTLAIKFIIESYGNALCDIVTNAIEALTALKNNKYEMVMLEKSIPGFDGTQVLEQMDLMVDYDSDNLGEPETLPIVVMANDELEKPKDFLAKPLKHFELITYLKKQDLNHFLSNNFAH